MTITCKLQVFFELVYLSTNFELYLSGAVGLEGAEHGDGLQEQLADANAAQVLVPLVQRELNPILQTLRESRNEISYFNKKIHLIVYENII